MKRFSVVLIITLSLLGWSCNRSQNTSKASDTEKKEAVDNSARGQFNYHGKYLGILPCADCEGIETDIHLKKDGTYTKTIKYVGKGDGKKYTTEGKFSWDKDGNIIILEGITDAPNKYYVTEGAITQLDMDGNVITGDLSNKYRLAKTNIL